MVGGALLAITHQGKACLPFTTLDKRGVGKLLSDQKSQAEAGILELSSDP
jgi:hypothetical protein